MQEKFKNSIFEMPIITQTLNLNDMRTKSANSINLHTIRKVVEYPLKNFVDKDNVYSSYFRDIAIRRQTRIVIRPAGTGIGGIKFH